MNNVTVKETELPDAAIRLFIYGVCCVMKAVLFVIIIFVEVYNT